MSYEKNVRHYLERASVIRPQGPFTAQIEIAKMLQIEECRNVLNDISLGVCDVQQTLANRP